MLSKCWVVQQAQTEQSHGSVSKNFDNGSGIIPSPCSGISIARNGLKHAYAVALGIKE